MPYFFLSYASADADGYLDQFYADLCDAVRSRTGHRASDIGFRDRSDVELGVDWPTRLAEAVASASVLVAVCSPTFFASELCGKEWQLFTDLAQRRQRDVDEQPASLLPIIWIPSRTVPAVARRLQHTHEGLGQVYRREGLHYLSRLRRYRDEYQMFVTRLAERIVTVGRPQPSPRPSVLPDIEAMPSAFGVSATAPAPIRVRAQRTETGPRPPSPARSPSTPALGAQPTPPSGGPRHVNFVVVAAPSSEVSHVRSDTQFYGPTPHDWAPYKPVAPQRICVFAQSIASTKDLTSALRPARPSIIGLLTDARDQNEIVVLLVDVWTTKLDPYHATMIEYDERNAPTSAVMVPWNEADHEMRERGDELQEDLRRAFPNNTARSDTVFRPALGTIKEFQTALEEVLAEAQARIFNFGTVTRRAGGDRVIERPILTPPTRGDAR